MNNTEKTNALVREEAQNREVVKAMAPAHIVRVMAGLAATRRAEMLEMVPVEALAPVLLQDARVFEPFERRNPRRGIPEGFIEELQFDEMRALEKAGHGNWLVELDWNCMGAPIKWGLRSFLDALNTDEARERLEIILECGNGLDWKRAAIRAIPVQYLALAIMEDPDEGVIRAIEAIDEDVGRNLRSALEESRKELFMRAMETRERELEKFKAEIELTDDGAKTVESLDERRTAKQLLASLRKSSPTV